MDHEEIPYGEENVTEELEYPDGPVRETGLPIPTAKEMSAEAAYIVDPPGEALETVFNNSTDEISATGSSGLLEEAQLIVSQEDHAAQIESIKAIITDPTIDFDIRSKMVDLYDQYLTASNETIPDIGEAVSIKAAAKSDYEIYQEVVERGLAAEANMFSGLAKNIVDTGKEIGVSDIGGMLLSYNEMEAMNSAVRETFPDLDLRSKEQASAQIEGGMDTVVKELLKLPVEARAERAMQFIESFSSYAGHLGSNAAMKKIAAVAMFERLSGIDDVDETNAWEYVDKLTAALEAMVIPGIAARVVKGVATVSGAVRRGSMISRIASANPDEAAQLASVGMRNRKVAEGLGTDPETLAIRNALPRTAAEQLEHVEPGTVNHAAQAILEESAAFLEETGFTVAGKTEDAIETVKQRLDKAQNTQVSVENSLFTRIGDTLKSNISLVFPKPITNANDALKQVYKFLGRSHQSGKAKVRVRLVEVDPATRKPTKLDDLETPEQQGIRRTKQEIEAKIEGLAAKPNTKAVSEKAKKADTTGAIGKLKAKNKENDFKLEGLETKISKLKDKAAIATSKGQDASKILKQVEGLEAKAASLSSKSKENAKNILDLEAKGAAKQRVAALRIRAESQPEFKALADDLNNLENGNLDKLSPETAARLKKNSLVDDPNPEYHYVVDVEFDTPISRVDTILFGKESIGNSFGGIMDWLLDPISKFSREITAVVERAVDKEARFRETILSLAKPYANMSNNSKLKVAKVLAQGDFDGAVYNMEQLATSFELTAKEIEGYLAYRRVNNLLFAVQNMQKTQAARNAGNKWFTAGDTNYLAKPMTEGEAITLASKSQLFDPVSHGSTKLTPEQVTDLYRRGGMVAYMDTAEDVGDARMSGLLVHAGDSVRVGEIPDSGIMKMLPGHVHRYYEDKYFVVETRKGTVNGSPEELFKVVRAVGSKTEAEDLAKTLDADAATGVKVTWRHDRQLGAAGSRQARSQAERGSQILKHGRRGPRLEGSSAPAAIDNPVTSLRKSVDAVARSAGMDNVVGKLETDYLSAFGDLSNGQYPGRIEDIGAGVGNKTDPDIGKAKMMFNYIENLKGMPSNANDQWKLFWVRFGESLEGTSLTTANVVKGMGDFNPVSALRSLAFNLFIVGNPVRQVFLQSQQVLFLAGLDPKYIFNPLGLFRQNSGLTLAHLAAKGGVDDVTGAWKLAALGLGVSVDEAKAMQKAIAETGLLDSVSAHTFLRDSLKHFGNEVSSNAMGVAVENVAAIKDTGLGILRKGFEWGELNNLQMSWLVARNQWLKKNPGKDWKTAGPEIHTMARGYALSMTKAGEMRYQRGALSMTTQFLSVQHKALLAMTSSNLFTPAQKGRILLGQLALFGAGGVGVREGYQYVRDQMGVMENETADAIIEGGMAEYLMDRVLLATTEEEVDLNLSGSFAAGGGLPNSVTQMVQSVLEAGEKSPLDIMLGPSSSALNRVWDAGKTINMIMAREDITTVEQVKSIIQEGGQLFSGVNNYWKMRAGMNLMAHVDKHGNPIMEAQMSELIAKGVFGVGIEKVDDLYRMYGIEGGRPPTAKDLDNIVDAVIGYMRNDVLERMEPELMDPSNMDMSLESQTMGLQSKLLEKYNVMGRMLTSLLDEDDAMQAKLRLKSRLANARLGTKEHALLERIKSNAIKGTTGKSLEDIVLMLTNSDLPNKDGYIELFKTLTERNDRIKESMGED